MSNPPGSSPGGRPTSSGSMAAASPMAPIASMAATSPATRTSGRKGLSRPVLEFADPSVPLRRSHRDDPMDFPDADGFPEKSSQLRSSSKFVPQATDSTLRREPVLSKPPKPVKNSLQAAKPSRRSAAATPGLRSHLLKNLFSFSFVAFIVVAGLATTVWNWKNRNRPSPLHASSMEGQVAELEAILLKTTKMMQVQLDLVDMKIHDEVERLRKELEEKIDEQSMTFGTELRSMLARANDVEASLRTLMSADFPSKQDILKLTSAIVDKRAAEGSGKALSLDDIRAVARHLVETELDKHAADGIGRVDYALGSGGGKVVEHSEGFYYGLRNGWDLLFGGFLPGSSNKHPLANKVLEPSFGEPGQCLPLKGSNVFVEIALRTSIYPDAFSLEHVAKSAAYDISSGPKEFRVIGWLDGFKKDDAAGHFMTQLFLGKFEYDVEKKYVQTFSVPQELKGKLVNMVRLEVLTNYGSPSHTCIYRFRVHGTESKVSLPLAGLV